MKPVQALPMGLALCVAQPSAAQLKPQMQTGSLIPVKPEAVDARRAGAIRKHFAQCIYRRGHGWVAALLQASDPVVVDLKAAGIKDVRRDFDMNDCLGNEAGVNESELGMKLSAGVLRDLLAEEDYLAKNSIAPQLAADVPALEASPISFGAQYATAQALMQFGDCAVRKDVADADALLRTMPASDAEHAKAASLAPALGGCLTAGQQMSLNPASIRGLVAQAMWLRFARGITIQ